MIKKTALLLAAFGMLSAGNAFAGSIGSCAVSGGIADVESIGSGDYCELGNFWFGDFKVVYNGLYPTPLIAIADDSYADGSGTAWLHFELDPQADTDGSAQQWTLTYSVTTVGGALFTGIDIQTGSVGSPYQIGETVCNGGVNAFGCDENYASLLLNSPGASTAVMFEDLDLDPLTGTNYIIKDIQIQVGRNGSGFISDFANSHHSRGGGDTDVPEPATMLLFSTALLGLGVMRRKKS